ncbi:MAG: hypothetical protein U1E46_09170 [Hyphomicrobiales bacterium]
MVRVASRKALMVTALVWASAVLAPIGPLSAMEFFQPYGSNDHMGKDGEPPLNSAQDRFNEQADVYQSEINRYQRERAYWNSYMQYNLGNVEHYPELPYTRNY